MKFLVDWVLEEHTKDHFIDALTSNLVLLRAKAEISQDELASVIGVSRQTYGTIERKRRRMTWNTYLSLILFYDYNQKTHSMLRNSDAFPHEFFYYLNGNQNSSHLSIDTLFHTEDNNILECLDEQALNTLKTTLMVEYARCSKLSDEAIINSMNGISFAATTQEDDANGFRSSTKRTRRKLAR